MSLQRKLHEFYLLDSRVRGLEQGLQAAKRRQKAVQTKLDQLVRQQSELADQVKHAQAKANTFERQAQDLDERVAHLREQMTQVKNNKEYSALLVEVNTIKLDKGKVEEQALVQMTQVEDLTAQLGAVQEKLVEQRKLLAGALAEVQEHEAEVGQSLREASAERDQAAALIPLDLRQVFSRLAASYDGEAMAGVIEENRRTMEYTCGGCYMSIPAEKVNALYTKPEQITFCPNCGRALYLGEELKAGMGRKE